MPNGQRKDNRQTATIRGEGCFLTNLQKKMHKKLIEVMTTHTQCIQTLLLTTTVTTHIMPTSSFLDNHTAMYNFWNPYHQLTDSEL